MFKKIKSIISSFLHEINAWINSIILSIPGKIGIYLRIISISLTQQKFIKISIEPGCHIIGIKNFILKNNISIGFNSFLNAEKSSIIIGNNFSSNHNLNLNAAGGGKIQFGDNVLIGPNVVFRTANHKTDQVEILIRLQGNEYGDIIVGNNVWIGSNCVILMGVTIGDGAVIAAGSIVNKNVLPFDVVGGVPAKKIKSRIKL